MVVNDVCHDIREIRVGRIDVDLARLAKRVRVDILAPRNRSVVWIRRSVYIRDKVKARVHLRLKRLPQSWCGCQINSHGGDVDCEWCTERYGRINGTGSLNVNKEIITLERALRWNRHSPALRIDKICQVQAARRIRCDCPC